MAVFRRRGATHSPGGGDADDAREVGPATVWVDVGEIGRVANDAAASPFETVVVQFGDIVWHQIGKQRFPCRSIGISKRLSNPLVQGRLVILEGQHIVSTLVHDLGGDGGLAPHRVNRDRCAFE